SGHELTVYDVMPDGPAEVQKLGAKIASSPADVARNADIIGVCVRNDKDVHDVLEGADGILSVARPGMLVLIHSTIRISTLREVVATAAKKGVHAIDAPVSRGSVNPGPKGIVFMLGGPPEDVARAEAFAEHAASKIIKTGALGTAMALKICNNLLTYLTMVSAQDAINL